jgi:prepilin-type N-terminal cleavage/methylation domain-containing protein
MSTFDNSRTRGFTIVELMMSLAVLAVGISGIIAMQKLTATTNMHSKSVAIATQVARAWQNHLLLDGTLWRRTTSINSTAWLKTAAANAPFFRPAFDINHRIGGAFDALGNPITDDELTRTQFCVHLQVVPIINLLDVSNATVRVTVRVLWPRAQGSPPASYCPVGDKTETIGNDIVNFHSIYQTIAIRVHP